MMSRQFREQVIRYIFLLIALACIMTLGMIVLFLFTEGIPIFSKVSVKAFIFGKLWYPTSDPPDFGIFPLIIASLAVTFLSSALSIPLGRSVERVPFDDITHVEAASNYVRVFTSARRLALRKPLGALQRELDEGFVRIHRSCIVNLAHVARVVSRGRRQRWVVLRNGRELKASAAGWRRIQTVIS